MQARIPARLEPSNLSRTDGKRPDGITTTSWKDGKSLIWDFTCTDTLCQTNVKHSVKEPGRAAEIRESHKEKIYENLTDNYHFVPICAETLGSWGPQGLAFINTIGKKLSAATGDPRSTFYLFQKLTMAVQRGNSQS